MKSLYLYFVVYKTRNDKNVTSKFFILNFVREFFKILVAVTHKIS